ncbi:molybdopterin-dependent oxidoreductase [Thermodesulfobacteriota bacterium]
MKTEETIGDTKIVYTGGCQGGDCGGRCLFKLHVKDGRVIKVEPDEEIRPCVRGYGTRESVYSPDRLKYPMKRVGARGEGKFERITWDEALDAVTAELKRVKAAYGNTAIMCQVRQYTGFVQAGFAVHKLLNMFGGYVDFWGGPSAEACVTASRATYGTLATFNMREDLVNSRLIIMWGWNPVVSISATNTSYHLIRAKEAGAKFICVDPRFTDSAAVLADQWIPIRPGTDTAMLIGMAYVMIRENLYDTGFIEKYTVGFDKFKAYVMGEDDDLPKTPLWAEAFTGVPAATIESLAREYATTKPAALMPAYGPGRTAYGEQFRRAAATLAAMTANIGISGGCAAGFDRIAGIPYMIAPGPIDKLPTGKNPLEVIAPPRPKGSVDTGLRDRYRFHSGHFWDALLRGRAGGYSYDTKFLWVIGGNPLNQFSDINTGVEALKKLETVIVQDRFMTSTARFADILLPVSSLWEQDDFARPWLSGPYFLSINKAIEPLYECKSDYEIAQELAPRLGIEDFSEKSLEEWRREIVTGGSDTGPIIKDYDKFKAEGVWRMKVDEPIVAFKKNIEDPENNPFPTPSGKIEIYCKRIARLNDPLLPPIPTYIETWESIHDPLANRFPLQLIGFKSRVRGHSVFDNLPLLKRLETQALWINVTDAQNRGIEQGDPVRIHNERGEVIVPAKVTQRIMPGVVGLADGGWFQPDEKGRDRGGCPNVLTKSVRSPGGAFITNTSLVQVEKWQKEV